VLRSERDVVDELLDRMAMGGGTVRARYALRAFGPTREPATRRVPSTNAPRAMSHEVGHGTARCRTDQPWRAASGRHGDARVAEHQPAEPVTGRRRPPHRDRAAPVVSCDDDLPLDPERADHVVEVAHPIGVGAGAGSRREPHPQLIDCDHAITTAEPREEVPPEERPRRIAVHADDGPDRARR
jgi:hypothetical protein